MKNLENISNTEENKIQKARKDFWNIAMVSHFTGELGGYFLSIIGGVFIPTIKNHGLDIDSKYLLGGIGIYVLLNGMAFVMKGISLTKEGNENLYSMWKDKSWFEKRLAKFHKYYAKRDEKNLKVLKKYNNIKSYFRKI